MSMMAFDGASTMRCLPMLLKSDVNPNALYFHFLVNCNKPVFKAALKLSTLLNESQELCESVYALGGASPKRIGFSRELKKSLKRNRWRLEDCKTLAKQDGQQEGLLLMS